MAAKYKAILVCMCTVIGLLGSSVLLAPPAAAVDDYPSSLRNAPQDSVIDPWRFYNRECTSFVAWRMNNNNGVGFTNFMQGGRWGNANDWDDNARRLGYPVDASPAVGAIAHWNGPGLGHVAWVQRVNDDGSVVVEEYNRSGDGRYQTRTTRAERYIHVRDIAATAPDGDGDGVPDAADGCPSVPGPAANGGCPVDNDVDGDSRADLWQIDRNGSGHTEVHVWDPRSRAFLTHERTPWTRTDTSRFQFAVGDVNGDGRADLWQIDRNGSGHTEVHVWDPRSRAFLTHERTPWTRTDTSRFQYAVGDANADGKADLWQIDLNATGFTDVHVLNPRTGGFLVHERAPWGRTDVNRFQYAVGDVNGDGRADLWQIDRNGSGYTEVHVWDVRSRRFVVHERTPWTRTNRTQFQYGVGDVNGDGRADLWQIDRNGSGYTEVHVWDPRSRAFLTHERTPWAATDLPRFTYPS